VAGFSEHLQRFYNYHEPMDRGRIAISSQQLRGIVLRITSSPRASTLESNDEVLKMYLPFLREGGMRPLGSEWAIKRLIKQARPYWPHLAGVLILSLAAAPLTLLLPLPLKIAVDSVISSQPAPGFVMWVLPAAKASSAAGLLGIAAGMLVLTTLLLYLQSLTASILQTYTGEKLVLDFRAVLFQHVQHLSLSYHDTRGSSDAPALTAYARRWANWPHQGKSSRRRTLRRMPDMSAQDRKHEP
jgi:hypothetical protein